MAFAQLAAELSRTERLRVEQIDVFTTTVFAGNPAAVVFGGCLLSGAEMQTIARETNLSETVFLLPPMCKEATWRARIFTVRREIDFAGHPVIAAADAISRRFDPDAIPSVMVQQCGAGLVGIHISSDENGLSYAVRMPSPHHIMLTWSPAFAASLLGLARGVVDGPVMAVATGAPWALVELANIADLDLLEPDFRAISSASRAAGIAGVAVFAEAAPGTIRLRTFAPLERIFEDPVCGSCMSSIAAHLSKSKRIARSSGAASTTITFLQGADIGRPGRADVMVRHTSDDVHPTLDLVGRCRLAMTGELRWPEPGGVPGHV